MERVQRDRLETESNGERQRAMEKLRSESSEQLEKARVSFKFQLLCFSNSLEQQAPVQFQRSNSLHPHHFRWTADSPKLWTADSLKAQFQRPNSVADSASPLCLLTRWVDPGPTRPDPFFSGFFGFGYFRVSG